MVTDTEKKPRKNKRLKPSQRQNAPRAKLKTPLSWKPFALAFGIILLVVVLLYPVGRDYYKTLRAEQRLQAQLDASLEYNDAAEAENDALQTPEGIENQAHVDLGWARPGEEIAVVTNQEGAVDHASRLGDKPDIDSIHAPNTWYYNILDTVFFVHE